MAFGYIRKDEFDDQFLAQLEAWQHQPFAPELRKKFLQAIVRARRSVDLQALARALEAEQLDLAVNLLIGPPDGPLWNELAATFRQALTAAANLWAGSLVVDNVLAAHVALNLANPATLRYMRRTELELIRYISANTRAGIRQYLTDSLIAGRNPRDLIPQLAGYVQPNGARAGGIIGLTPRQAQAVSNYRKFLEELRPEALERALRDKRFDSTVRAALESGQQLDKAYIDKLVRRYEANYLAYRAETIARTESIKALAAGQQAVWLESIATKKIRKEQLIKRWITAEDERVRPAHAAMHGKEVPFDEPFVMEDGREVFGPPVDPNCRCLNWIRPKIRRVA